MKKAVLTIAALALLALGSLAMSYEQPVCNQSNASVCQPSDCCPIPCSK